MYICIEGSGTYPCTVLSKRVLQKYIKKARETQKRIRKNDVFHCRYSGDRQGRYLRCASCSFLNAFTVEAVTTSVGRSFHTVTTLSLKINMHRSSLDQCALVLPVSRHVAKLLDLSVRILIKLRLYVQYILLWHGGDVLLHIWLGIYCENIQADVGGSSDLFWILPAHLSQDMNP